MPKPGPKPAERGLGTRPALPSREKARVAEGSERMRRLGDRASPLPKASPARHSPPADWTRKPRRSSAGHRPPAASHRGGADWKRLQTPVSERLARLQDGLGGRRAVPQISGASRAGAHLCDGRDRGFRQREGGWGPPARCGADHPSRPPVDRKIRRILMRGAFGERPISSCCPRNAPPLAGASLQPAWE